MTSDTNNDGIAGSGGGFATSLDESAPIRLEVQGKVPSWLNGALLRTGPALFEYESAKYAHWFDGLAKLYRFSINNGEIEFSSRFLQSEAYRSLRSTGKTEKREFATDPQYSLLQRLGSLFSPNFTDNANVNVARFSSDCYVALTEPPTPVQFDPSDLKTIGHLNYDDRLKFQVSTAHPHLDADGTVYNVFIKMGMSSSYVFCSMPAGKLERKVVANIPVKEPGYVHSFALTDNYIILAEGPYRVSPLSLVLGDKPYIENFQWHKEQPSRFIIVPKIAGGGSGVQVIEGEPFFVFHHVNAYEHDNEIVLDLIAYDDSAIVDALYLRNLRSSDRSVPHPALRRYILNVAKRTARREDLGAELELPRINYARNNGKQYQFVYGVTNKSNRDIFTGICKFDVSSNAQKFWSDAEICVGEPVFVDATDCSAEDSGALLSIGFNVATAESFLLLFDSSTMSELARARLPHLVPFHFHGQFFRR